MLIELDGELGHEGPVARIRGGRRDRRGATRGWLTMRAFWPDVTGTPCDLAREVSEVLTWRGRDDVPRRCRRRGCGIVATCS